MTAATNPPSPPSARDFNVYEHVAVEGYTTRQAAEKFKLSQTRVCQVIRNVAAFATDVLPGVLASEIPEAQRLAVSKNVAALRLQHLYEQSMAAWRNSEGEAWRVRESKGGSDVVRTTWKERRKIAYLDQAMKISERALEMDLPLPMCMFAEDEDESESGGEPAAAEVAEEKLDEVRGDEPAGNKSPDNRPAASERLAALAKLEQLVKSVGRLHDDLEKYDRRRSADPRRGDCSKPDSPPLPAATAVNATEAQPAVPQPEPSAAVPAPTSPPPPDQGLFSESAPLKLPLPPRAEGERLSRRQRRARKRQAAELLRERRSLATVG